MKEEILDFIHYGLKTVDLANLNREHLVNCFEELEKENAELKKENENLASIAEHQQSSNMKRYFEIEELKRKNTDLEEKISVLLSCKNCPENKGGLICQKEYENKCLAQKIEFIKELQKENAELKEQQFSLRNERNTFLAQNEQYEKDLIDFNETLTKAKELLKRCYENYVYLEPLRSEIEQFLNSEVEK